MAAIAVTACPECGGPARPDGIEAVCADCGLVVDEDALDHGPEWRPFDADERERVGAPRTLKRHDRGLGAVIGYGDGIPGRQRWEDRQAKVPTKKARNRRHGHLEIRRLVESLELRGPVHETAAQLFEEAQDGDHLVGRSIEAMAAAAVLAASRIHGHPAPLADVADVAPVSRSGIRSSYRVLDVDLGAPIPPTQPADHVPRIADRLGVDVRTATQAASLAHEHAADLQGRNPVGAAAAAVYVAAGGTLTQGAAAEAADVTRVTIRTGAEVLADE